MTAQAVPPGVTRPSSETRSITSLLPELQASQPFAHMPCPSRLLPSTPSRHRRAPLSSRGPGWQSSAPAWEGSWGNGTVTCRPAGGPCDTAAGPWALPEVVLFPSLLSLPVATGTAPSDSCLSRTPLFLAFGRRSAPVSWSRDVPPPSPCPVSFVLSLFLLSEGDPPFPPAADWLLVDPILCHLLRSGAWSLSPLLCLSAASCRWPPCHHL